MSTIRYPFDEPPAPGTARMALEGLHWLRMPLPMALNHINLYLLEDEGGMWIVDTGLGDEITRSHWQNLFQGDFSGQSPQAVLCTHMHPDHTGQAGWLCREWDIPLYMSLGEYMSTRIFQEASRDGDHSALEHIRLFYRRAGMDGTAVPKLGSGQGRAGGFPREPLPPVYRRLQEGDVLEIGGRQWRIIVGRGHSPEHACLYCERDGLLLAGDQVLPRISPNISLMPMEPEGNPLRDWFQSLQRLGQLPEDTLIFPAHNTPFYGLQERLQALEIHHHRHLESLVKACAEPRAAVELMSVMFSRKLEGIQSFLAIGECLAHLNYLITEGRLERSLGEDGRHLYSAVSS